MTDDPRLRAEARGASSQCAAPDDALVAIWRALGAVADPEIPVISVVELGVVRAVTQQDDGCAITITLTPTYSGCPATRVIEADVRVAASRATTMPLRVVTALSPAWSTDWIAPEARRKLAAAGIAPPHGTGQTAQPVTLHRVAVRCPQCGSLRTRELARFGSTPCKAQYRCGDCLEPFDYVKPH